jgi:opacity protein-like surface antigen
VLKKCLLATCLLISAPNMVYATSGIYPWVGAGLGVTANTATKDYFGSFRGVPFNVLIGFGGVVYQNFFIAAELTGTLFTAELSNQGAVKTNYGVGLSIMPGIELCDSTILFGRLGVVRTHFSQVRVPTTSTTANLTGGQFGAGIQTALTQNIDIRGEYSFMDYGSLSADGYSAKPRSDIALASLIYKFA